MLNATRLIQYIEAKLGYKFTELEVDHNEILKYIRNFTLPEYSKYFPYIQRIQLSNCPRAEGFENAFYVVSDLEIIGIEKVLRSNVDYIDPSIMTRDNFYTGDPFLGQMQADAISQVKNPITHRFYNDCNIIELYPTTTMYDNAIILCKCVHADNFATIGIDMEDYFKKLALLDVKSMLYQMRHRFSNLQTVYGEIELFIDDLSDAEEKKEDLLEKFRRNASKGKYRRKIFTTLDN